MDAARRRDEVTQRRARRVGRGTPEAASEPAGWSFRGATALARRRRQRPGIRTSARRVIGFERDNVTVSLQRPRQHWPAGLAAPGHPPATGYERDELPRRARPEVIVRKTGHALSVRVRVPGLQEPTAFPVTKGLRENSGKARWRPSRGGHGMQAATGRTPRGTQGQPPWRRLMGARSHQTRGGCAPQHL